jgi:prevent-host-death family protein
MKRKKKIASYPIGKSSAISVREAKSHFSALLGRAAEGEEITITWHGQPRARLVPVSSQGEVLHVDRAWLKSMPLQKRGQSAEKLVRTDRDARG